MKSLIKSEQINSPISIEYIRQNNAPTEEEISERGPNEPTGGDVLASDTNNSVSSATTSSGKENPEEDYIRDHLKTFTWFHGTMFGNIVEKLLKWDNSFLVRRAMIRSKQKFLCVSVKLDKKIYHYQLNYNEEGWNCPKLYAKFPKIPKKRYTHVVDIINAWSKIFPILIPIPRRSMVLQHKSIILGNRLGHGAFGEVFKAKYFATGATEPIEVAAKRVLGDAKRAQIQEFCHEASIMAVLQNENVVQFYGIASLEEPIMVVMEMVTGGDLKKYLQVTPNIPKVQILLFAVHIANGMRHLAAKNIIHRDLAARNCLITKDLKVKISDFGLSIQGTDVIVKNLKKAPIRWLAPETLLKGIFNEKTDVWSYGVVLTELMTRCANDPLHPKTLQEARKWIQEAEFPHRIENGDPMELMILVDACCDKNPENRINFHTVKRRAHAIYARCMGGIANTSMTNSATFSLETQKSEEKHTVTATLSRKKSLDGRSKTSTRRRFFSLRRKNKEGPALPTGMSIETTTKPSESTGAPSTTSDAQSTATGAQSAITPPPQTLPSPTTGKTSPAN